MTGTTIRELNEREKEVLERRLAMEKPPREPRGPWLGCLIISFILGGLAYFFRWTQAGWPLLGLCLLGFLITMILSMANFRWRKERLGVEIMLGDALEDNRVEIARIEASALVIEIDDHGTKGYYFDVGGGRILRLELGSIHWPAADPGDGHALYVSSDDDIWPNDRFEIVRTLQHRLWVGVFPSGNRLEPFRQINTSKGDPLVRKCESPVALFEGSLDELRNAVTREPVEVWK